MKKPRNYYCHKGLIQQEFKIGQKKLELVQKIGQGSFGQVYKAFDPETCQIIVIKKLKKVDQYLSQQARILSQLSTSEGFDKLKTVSSFDAKKQNQDQNQNFSKLVQQNESAIIMGCLGPSTSAIMKRIKKMNIYSMKRIAFLAIKKLKQIHSKLYVHRDIKPDNILFGNKYDSHSIYFVDFGLAMVYRKTSTKAKKVFQSIIGTAKYCPLASHLGLQQYPKDDLQSLGYVLLYFISGFLPWENEQGKTEEQLFHNIFKSKQQCSIEDLCRGVNCLRKYWNKIKCLKIGEKIDYEQLSQIFDVGDNSLSNCFQFCQDCWVRSGQNKVKRCVDIVYSVKKESQVKLNEKNGTDEVTKLNNTRQQNMWKQCQKQIQYEPKVGLIRSSIIS